jgi:Predicted AAA-ATPase/PD-(D/E)XK nuclease superfamily
MIKISYGESNFRSMILDGAFYQDRTHYIPILEEWGAKNLIYLRPRRFGKSLLLSTLEYYYGLQYKDSFEQLYGNTFVGKNPTSRAHSYMILRFDFSGINTDTEQNTFEGFLSNIRVGMSAFLAQYQSYFTEEQAKDILSHQYPNEMIKELINCYVHNKITFPIYVLVDEYDHFANELISFNFTHFSEIVTANGYVRKFYEVLKIASSQGVIDRIFITGVSPITVDSLTSGFNISRNITLSADFHQMVGFEESEVKSILEGVGMPAEQVPATVNDLHLWYNGYLFCADSEKRLYNPNMVLYFAQEYKSTKAYPREMLDVNIASDYGKIQKLFSIQGKEEQYLYVLEELLENGEVTAVLTAQYSFLRDFTKDDLVSLLFYMGFLTIKSANLGAYTFTFPNYVIKRLYADYFFNSILDKAKLPFDNRPVNNAIMEMAQTGNPTKFFDQVQLVIKYFSTRDTAHFTENTLKAIIVSLLHQQKFYYIHSEYETNWTYMDVFLEAIQGQKPNFEVTLELKFAQKKSKISLPNLLKEAELQLQNYLQTPKFNARTNLKNYCVAVVGDKLAWKEVV